MSSPRFVTKAHARVTYSTLAYFSPSFHFWTSTCHALGAVDTCHPQTRRAWPHETIPLVQLPPRTNTADSVCCQSTRAYQTFASTQTSSLFSVYASSLTVATFSPVVLVRAPAIICVSLDPSNLTLLIRSYHIIILSYPASRNEDEPQGLPKGVIKGARGDMRGMETYPVSEADEKPMDKNMLSRGISPGHAPSETLLPSSTSRGRRACVPSSWGNPPGESVSAHSHGSAGDDLMTEPYIGSSPRGSLDSMRSTLSIETKPWISDIKPDDMLLDRGDHFKNLSSCQTLGFQPFERITTRATTSSFFSMPFPSSSVQGHITPSMRC